MRFRSFPASFGFRCLCTGSSKMERRDRGALVVLEGCDRCGKSTQCKKLVETLEKEGKKVKLWRFPDRTTVIGQMISSYLQQESELEDHVVHLLFTANRWEAVPKMKELLLDGTTLIVDRYSYSGVAFTAAKKGMNMEWCKQPEVGLPKPDLVLYLDLSAEEAEKRADFGGERYENSKFQRQVAENFKVFLNTEDNWTKIDANKSIADLHSELKEICLQVMDDIKNKELEQLWVHQKEHLKDVDDYPPAKKMKKVASPLKTRDENTTGVTD